MGTIGRVQRKCISHEQSQVELRYNDDVSFYVRGTIGVTPVPVSRASHSILVRGRNPSGDWTLVSACSASHNGGRHVHDAIAHREELVTLVVSLREEVGVVVLRAHKRDGDPKILDHAICRSAGTKPERS